VANASRHNNASHLIRTRPDLLYFDLRASFDPARLAAMTLPTMVRKAERDSFYARALYDIKSPGVHGHHEMVAKGAIEVWQPGDWFMVVPLNHATVFFQDLLAPLQRVCAWAAHSQQLRYSQLTATSARALWLSLKGPANPSPETYLLAKQRGPCNASTMHCAGGPIWYAPWGSPYGHNAHFKGVECEPGVAPWHYLGQRCIANFPVVMIPAARAAGYKCIRLNASPACDERAQRVMDAPDAQAAEAAAEAAAAPW
jgi:hypothetical protein